MQEVDKSWHADRPPWQIVRGDGPIITTAIHAGHDVRPELADYLAISEEQRRREEDPLTGFWTTVGDSSVLVFRSRFEVDMNRSRNAAIVRDPESAWGLNVWTDIPPAE
jgi:N-formylglutamate amidohydrolase